MSKKPAKPARRKAAAVAPKAPRPSALAREGARALVEQIRRLQALPPEQRTHFLRMRLPGGGSSL